MVFVAFSFGREKVKMNEHNPSVLRCSFVEFTVERDKEA